MGEDVLEKLRKYGEDIERRAFLRTYPMAVKLLKDESEIPSGCARTHSWRLMKMNLLALI